MLRRGWGILVILLAATGPVSAQSLVPPAQQWQTFATPHFQVIFEPGLEPLARHAAERAEAALSTLEARGFGQAPRQRIQLVVSDHLDLPSGSASVIPYPRIVVGTLPPVHGVQAMPFDDWLDFVILHEMVHILHLESTGPLGRVARRIFGRVPVAVPFFPAFALPSWALEGVAVHGETAHTTAGRLYGTRFQSTLNAQALAGKGDRLDQAMGQSPLFPGGERPYIGGGAFFHDLAEREGTAAVNAFFERQATRLNPLRLNASAREAFGLTLAEAHLRWTEDMTAQARALEAAAQARARVRAERGDSPLPTPTLVTRGARVAAFPVLTRRSGSPVLVWMEQDGGSLLRLRARAWNPGETSGHGESASAVGPRLHQVGPLSVGPDGTLWTAQLEAQDRYRIRGELWAIAPDGSARRRLGRELRISQVDVHPVHGGAVALLETPGTNTLAVLEAGGTDFLWRLPPDAGVHWANPRWSPDGAAIAVVRWRAGGFWGVGIMDAARSATEPPRFQLVTEGRAPIHGVTWSADGQSVIWSSEASGVANLYAAPLSQGTAHGTEGIRQITDVATAVHYPTVLEETLFFSYLGADGWDLAHIPMDSSSWFDPLPTDPRFLEAGGWAEAGTSQPAGGGGQPNPALEGARAAEITSWRPWETLRPFHWMPRVQVATEDEGVRVLAPTLGLSTWGRDAVGRHAWDLALDAPLSGPRARWEGSFGWQWAGLGDPVLTGRVSRSWSSLGGIASTPFYVGLLEQSAGVSASFQRPRLSSVYQLSFGARSLRESLHLLEAGGEKSTQARLVRPVRDLWEGSVALVYSSVVSTPMGPGPQMGSSALLRLRSRMEPGLPDSLQQRPGPGGDARRDDVLVSVRHFMPVGFGWRPRTPSDPRTRAGGAPPVLALRGAAAVARGPGAGPTTWALGGGGGGGATRLGMTWDRPPGVFQVRGWQEGVLRGERAWGAGAELRIPAAVIHRGFGVLPLYLDRLAVAGWVDAAGSEQGTLASSGVEAILLHGDFSWQPGILRVGLAFPIGSSTTGDPLPRPGSSIYAALGWSF